MNKPAKIPTPIKIAVARPEFDSRWSAHVLPTSLDLEVEADGREVDALVLADVPLNTSSLRTRTANVVGVGENKAAETEALERIPDSNIVATGPDVSTGTVDPLADVSSVSVDPLSVALESAVKVTLGGDSP